MYIIPLLVPIPLVVLHIQWDPSIVIPDIVIFVYSNIFFDKN
jgi:hypothetical protein